MAITCRAYDHPTDFERVNDFLVETYRPQSDGRFRNWLYARWEYALTHGIHDEAARDRIGVWEEEGRLVAAAHYELRLGQVSFELRPGYEHLKAEMLTYAEQHLWGTKENGQRYMTAMIPDFDGEMEQLARARGYEKREDCPEWMSAFEVPDPFPSIALPEGFHLRSLADENDLVKVNRVMWRGFNHEGDPPWTEEFRTGRMKMQSGPHFRKDLTIVVHAPDGNYAAFCGMWYDPTNRVAYVEPVATDPDYRRLGLGKAAVLEGIRRCAELGATVAWVASGQPFYLAFGFRKVFANYPWVKRWDG